jgi:hypothetical protein
MVKEIHTMQYLLMLYLKESDWPAMTKAQQEQGVAAYGAYTEALTKANVLKGTNRLRPTSDATTIRVADGKPQVLDGPYADSKEQLGGYYMIDVPDLDAAISWAARCPTASHGTVEVRPIWEMYR